MKEGRTLNQVADNKQALLFNNLKIFIALFCIQKPHEFIWFRGIIELYYGTQKCNALKPAKKSRKMIQIRINYNSLVVQRRYCKLSLRKKALVQLKSNAICVTVLIKNDPFPFRARSKILHVRHCRTVVKVSFALRALRDSPY